jgi:polysaccharide biosynthesis protein PslG
MSEPTSYRSRRTLRLGFGAFGLVALVVAAVLAGGTVVHRLVSGGSAVTPVDSSDAARAVRHGPRRAGGGATVGQAIGGFANAAQFLFQDDASLNADLDAMQNTGATWIRFDFLWTYIEPDNNKYQWTVYDKVIGAAKARGFTILAELDFTPPWARGAACNFSDKCPPGDIAAWQEFIATTVNRYKGLVSHWEIWNEPNLRSFWETGPDPAAYTALLKASYPVVKQADPNAVVVSGGLAPAGLLTGDMYPPLDFLKGMYAAGVHGSFDAFGMHPYTYPFTPDEPKDYNNYYSLGSFYDVMSANGDANKQIWSTEAGAPTGTAVESDRRAISEAQQALTATRIYEIAAQRPWQGPVLWFCFRDYGTDPNNIEQNFGIVRNDSSPKPSYAAYVAAMQLSI